MQKSLFENEMLNIVQKPTLHKTDVSRSTFYHGDCLVESQNIENYSVDLILTDLPYGTTACSWDEIIPFEPMWKEFYRVLRPNGFIVLTASQPFTSKLVSSNINNFSHNWVWNKIRGVGHLLAKKTPNDGK
jgi:site-specific DNA-methyltransferase (adenine-specific)